MKLEPIKNPHAKLGGQGGGTQKKSKQEEKDDLIEKTKKTTLDKYGVSYGTRIYHIWKNLHIIHL